MTDDLYIWAAPHDIDAARGVFMAALSVLTFVWEGRRVVARRQENQG